MGRGTRKRMEVRGGVVVRNVKERINELGLTLL